MSVRGNGRSNLAASLGEHEVVVCVGAGGVGKTTISAALAMAIAAEHDKRVMVVTVDPARRLATALGLHRMTVDPVIVPADRLRRAGVPPRDQLVAAMIDMKSTWDRLVERNAPDRRTAARILANPFYQGISGAFTGSHEFIAMETLYELHHAGEFDCLVVDTPPSRSALDFLEAPTRFSDFVGGRLLSWLARPSLFGWRTMNFAAAPFLRMADRLLGADLLEDLASFVADIQRLYGGVQKRAADVYSLLRSYRTAFTVITTLEPAPFAEAEFFSSKLREFSMPMRALVVNRVLPPALLDEEGAAAASTMIAEPAAAEWLADALDERVARDAPRHIAEAYTVLHRLAQGHARQVSRLSRLGRAPAIQLPQASRDVSDIESLAMLAQHLRGRGEQ